MPTYLENRVQITPKFWELINLLRKPNTEYSDYGVAKILGLVNGTWYSMLKNCPNIATVDASVYEKAKEHLTVNLGYTEEALCQRLQLKNLDDFFMPPVPDYDFVLERCELYLQKKETSKANFIRELKESDPYLASLGHQTFIDFLKHYWERANPKMLIAVNAFLDSQQVESMPENEKVDLKQVVYHADSYIKKTGINKKELAKQLSAYDPSLGEAENIARWLSLKHRPDHPQKIRVIRQFLEEKEKPWRRNEMLNYLLHEISPNQSSLESLTSELRLDVHDERACRKIAGCLEEKIVGYYSHRKTKKEAESFDLPERIMLHLFSPGLCRRLYDFPKMHPRLTDYLYKTYGFDLSQLFKKTLALMPEESLWQVADNFNISVAGVWPLIEEREMKISYFNKRRKEEHESYRQKAAEEVKKFRKNIEKEILKKIS